MPVPGGWSHCLWLSCWEKAERERSGICRVILVLQLQDSLAETYFQGPEFTRADPSPYWAEIMSNSSLLHPEPAQGQLSLHQHLWMNEWSKHQLLRVPKVVCPFSRTEVVLLYIKLQKELGVHMDRRVSYCDPSITLSSGWKLLSNGQKPDVFTWLPSPLILEHIVRYCSADSQGKGHSEWTNHFFLLSPKEMMNCSCWHYWLLIWMWFCSVPRTSLLP